MTDAVLQRLAFRPDGIFSVLSLDGAPRFFTLEHAFASGGQGACLPIIPPGTYQCVLGAHKLAAGIPFQTYEVVGVAGHSGLLFHAGNVNADSEGCILLGGQTGFLGDSLEVLNSRLAFSQFMDWAAGRPSFEMVVLT